MHGALPPFEPLHDAYLWCCHDAATTQEDLPVAPSDGGLFQSRSVVMIDGLNRIARSVMVQAGFACRVRRQPASHETMARLNQSVTTRSTSSSPSLPSPISTVTHDSKHDGKLCHKHPQGSFTEALDEFDRKLEEDSIFGGALLLPLLR